MIEQNHRNSRNPRSSNKLPKSSSHLSKPMNEEDYFFMSNGIRKRRIFYHVQYSQEEKKWINEVKFNLKSQKDIEMHQKQVLLRYYYSSDLKMDPCIKNLEAHYRWFNDPDIQTLSREAKQLIKAGFVYSYDFSLDGRPFAIMELGDVNIQKHQLNSYMQALNYVNNKMIEDKLTKGQIETYDYILDLNEKFMSLPVTALKDIVRTISEAYSMMLGKMFVVNCTTLAKSVYSVLQKMMSEETQRKIRIFTAKDVRNGALREFIDENVLEQKYGGKRQNLNHQQWFADMQREQMSISQQTSYYSLDEDNPMFTKKESQVCCGTKECIIY